MDALRRARAGQLFGALSHPTRIRIVELLLPGPRSVNEIAGALGAGQSGTSQHLSILARSGVVVAEHRGATRLYRVRGPRIERILALIEEFCRVHDLGAQVEEEPV
jgi:DNA-binding transcriptional ArsR family regulator